MPRGRTRHRWKQHGVQGYKCMVEGVEVEEAMWIDVAEYAGLAPGRAEDMLLSNVEGRRPGDKRGEVEREVIMKG
jgi:hypothetical protein